MSKLDDILDWSDKGITTRIEHEPTEGDIYIVNLRKRLTHEYNTEIKQAIQQLIDEEKHQEYERGWLEAHRAIRDKASEVTDYYEARRKELGL